MKLDEFLSQFPHVFRASETDNESILAFYHQTAMSTNESSIAYLRGDDFFAFLKERSDSFLVLLLKDDHGVIQGLGVVSFRPGYINGELQTVGYLGDLRVKLNRKLVREWRTMYAKLIKHSPEIEETGYCKYYQTVLIDENIESKNNLAETKIPNLFYQRLMRYNMVNMIGRFKLYTSTHPLRFATKNDQTAIEDFLIKVSPKEHFAHNWGLEISHRLKNWHNFDLENFILALDNNGKIMALSMLWNPIQTKQVSITKVPTTIKLLHHFLKFVPFIELKKLPIPNSPLDILYLNQIQFDCSVNSKEQKSIALDMLHFSFQKDCHMIAYADFEDEGFLKKTRSIFAQSMPMALYSVHYKNDDTSVSFPLKEGPVYFDISLV